jgi:oligopeptide transport system substrate-binding protein
MKKIYKILIWCLPLFIFANEIKQNKEQILKVNLLGGTPKYLHPHLACDTGSFIICQALFENLTRLDIEEKVELALAKKIEISPCKTKYTIYLRPSVWSNGKELNAHHFVNAWKAAIIPGTKCNRPSRFFVIKNAKKVFQGQLTEDKLGIYASSKYQIIVHLEHPTPYFTKLLASPTFAPLFDLYEDKITVFNGPFNLKSIQPGKDITLIKNLLFWDVKNIRLDEVNISLIQDEMTAYKLFQKGKLDFVGSPLSDLPEDIMQKFKNQLKKVNSYGAFGVYFCLNDPKVQSKKIRQALNLAINREHIANYLIPNANPNYSILPKKLSNLNLNTNSFSKKTIKNLFNEGLKELNLQKKNYSLEISCTSMSRHTKIAEYLKHCWEDLFDIKIIIRKSDWITLHSKLTKHNFTIGECARFVTYEDPLDFLEFFLSPHTNYSNWENPIFNKWINLANNTTSEKKRKRYLRKAEEILMDEVPAITIYSHQHLYLCNPTLKNLIPSKLIYCNFRWAYFDK